MTDAAAERAREIYATLICEHIRLPLISEKVIVPAIAAALRAAEAGAIERTLTAAAEWHDARYVELRDNPDGRFGLVSGISGARMHEHRESAEHFRALASPSAMGEHTAPLSEIPGRVLNDCGPVEYVKAGTAAASPWREIEAAAQLALDTLNYAISFGYHYDRIVEARDALRAALPLTARLGGDVTDATCKSCKYFLRLSPGHAAICMDKWRDLPWNAAVPLTTEGGHCENHAVFPRPSPGRAEPPREGGT